MSGAEALGLACNIFAVINFAHETISLCKSVYQGNLPSEELHQSAQLLAATSKDLQSQNDALQQRPRTASQKRLHDVALKCNIAARGLQEETEYLSKHQKKGDLMAMMKVAAKSKWRKSRLERFERSMAECRNEMDTQLLHRICSQADAIILQQKGEFANLNRRIQNLITGIAAGRDQAVKLVSNAAAETQDHVTKNLNLVEKALKLHINDSLDRSQSSSQRYTDDALGKATERILADNQAMDNRRLSENDRVQLLNSLKFPQMNERRNTLAYPEEDTYRWIFETAEYSEDGSETDGSSDDLDSRSSDEYSYYTDSTAESTPEDYGPIFDDFVYWLQSDAKSYWISGKAGSGKSTLLKSIASAPESLAALKVWSEDTVTISYYFWKAGSPLQRSLRGLYCDLLYQLLTLRPSSLDGLAARSSTFSGAKPQEHTDWSTKKLRQELEITLEEYPCSVCIFVDGLDEVCDEDGSAAVFDILGRLILLQNVKACVSSRPEPAFQKALGHWPQLRMETLTWKDMEIFSRRQLTSAADWPLDQLDTLLQDVVEKAEGVFLWLHLAVKNLRSGLDIGDELEDLKKRLQDLPGELEHLYWDMWQRSTKGSSVHREFSSSIIELLIQFRQFDHGQVPSCSFTLALASQPNLLQDDFSISAITDEIHNEEFWKAFETRVSNRCAGIVEFARWGEHYLWTDSVTFIHRSAYDFFAETEKGQLIRSHGSKRSQIHHIVCTAVLLEVPRLPGPQRHSVLTGMLISNMHKLQAQLCLIPVRLLRESAELGLGQEVAFVFKRHHKELERSSRVLSARFLSLSVAFMELEDLVIACLTNMGRSERRYATSIILRHLLSYGDFSRRLAQRLLDLGADFAEIGTNEDILLLVGDRKAPKSALTAFFTRLILQGHEKSELLYILQQPDLPLSQKAHFAIVFGEDDDDALRVTDSVQLRYHERLPNAAHLSVSGWSLCLVVNLAHLLKIIIENIRDDELSNLAAVHLRMHQPAAACIACIDPCPDHTAEYDDEIAYFIPEQKIADRALDFLSRYIEPQQLERRAREEIYPWQTFHEDVFRGAECSSWIRITAEDMHEYILSHLELPFDITQPPALPPLLHVRRRGGGYLTHLQRSHLLQG